RPAEQASVLLQQVLQLEIGPGRGDLVRSGWTRHRDDWLHIHVGFRCSRGVVPVTFTTLDAQTHRRGESCSLLAPRGAACERNARPTVSLAVEAGDDTKSDRLGPKLPSTGRAVGAVARAGVSMV